MKILYRTQAAMCCDQMYTGEVIDGNHEILNIPFDCTGYYIFSIRTESRGWIYTMSKKKKDKKKFEKLLRDAHSKGKIDVTEFVFIVGGTYEDEPEKFFKLRFNKANGYTEEVPSR